jgi:hypothetical protein
MWESSLTEILGITLRIFPKLQIRNGGNLREINVTGI